ncbi:nucleotidyltransferase family protein [Occallatibacter savannae]|uniref:nucleotidyltransferase family protein n=1 Tax=Occallatibacter savannae TaxID=1002691 RepID=UPI000D68F677|nr:nucleotidyltransferase family protein [Occallatibacter savannae]
MKDVAAVIIAAGASRRLGQPKQLLTLNGETLLARCIRTARAACAGPVFVVLGAHRHQIETQVDLSAANIVVNDSWEQGMASSITAGVQALMEHEPDATGVLLLVCDQPAVTPEHLGRMFRAFRQNPTNVIASTYAGKRGIPAIFPAQAFQDLLALRGDQGARRLLAEADRSVAEIPLEGGELDIDSPEDASRLIGLPDRMQY